MNRSTQFALERLKRKYNTEIVKGKPDEVLKITEEVDELLRTDTDSYFATRLVSWQSK